MAPMFPVAAAGLSPSLFQRAAQVVEVWEGPYMFLHVGGGGHLEHQRTQRELVSCVLLLDAACVSLKNNK